LWNSSNTLWLSLKGPQDAALLASKPMIYFVRSGRWLSLAGYVEAQ
jgi:hypothetical protein